MSNLLICEMVIDSAHPASYWRPLLFESLRHGGYSFFHPERGERQGIFHTREFEGDLDDYDQIVDFRGLWDAILQEPADLLAQFWRMESEPAQVWASHNHVPDTGQLILSLTYPIEYLIPDTDMLDREQEQARRLRHWFESVTALYLLCRPGVAEIGWQKYAGEVGVIGRPLQPELEKPPGIVTTTLPNGAVFSRFEPFPIPSGNAAEWRWITVSDPYAAQ